MSSEFTTTPLDSSNSDDSSPRSNTGHTTPAMLHHSQSESTLTPPKKASNDNQEDSLVESQSEDLRSTLSDKLSSSRSITESDLRALSNLGLGDVSFQTNPNELLSLISSGDLSSLLNASGGSVGVTVVEDDSYDYDATEIDLCMLFASPLVYNDNDKIRPLQLLDLRSESTLLLKILKNTKKGLRVRQDIATVENFRFLISTGCRAFHYSGHGFPSCLAFENDSGGLHDLKVETLKQLFSVGDTAGDETAGVRFVFVSACYSEVAGNKFVEAGVPHVVAVQQDKQVEDTAATKFSLFFYHSLVKGKSVQMAYDIAKQTVAALPPSKGLPNPEAASNLFKLLPEDGDHEEIIFNNLPDSGLKELSPIPANNLLPFPDDFVGRQVDLYQVMQTLMKGRFTTLFGDEGIGKSTVAKALAQYVNERRFFEGGVVWGELRGVKDMKRCAKMLMRAMALDMSVGNDRGDMEDAIWERIHSTDEKLLLILDDVDSLVENDGNELNEYVGGLLQRFGHLHVLMTLRNNLDRPAYLAPNGYQLKALQGRDSALLFNKLTSRGSNKINVQELLDENGKPPKELLKPGQTKFTTLDLLAAHPVCKVLNGNPLNLLHAAAKYNAVPGRTLNELHDILMSEDAESEGSGEGSSSTSSSSSSETTVSSPKASTTSTISKDGKGEEQGNGGQGSAGGSSSSGTSSSSSSTSSSTSTSSVNINIADDAAREMWLNNFGGSLFVPWDEFDAALQKTLNVTGATLGDLKEHLLDSRNEAYKEMVTQESFTVFLKWFGPFGECVTKASDTLNQTWFHASLDSAEAAKLLKEADVGTYLVRFSSSFPGQFIVTFVRKPRKGKKKEIVGQPIKNVAGRGYTIDDKQHFNTLEDFISAYRKRLKKPLPRSNYGSNYDAWLFDDDSDEEDF